MAEFLGNGYIFAVQGPGWSGWQRFCQEGGFEGHGKRGLKAAVCRESLEGVLPAHMPQLSVSERNFRAAGTREKALVSASSGFVEAYVGPGLLTCSLCGGLQAALFPAGGVFPDIHLRVQSSAEGGHDVSSVPILLFLEKST